MPLTRFKLSAIADGGIETADLADDAVTTAKIEDGAVTLAKTDSLFLNTEISGTEAARMPVGTTAQRANAQSGDIRFNSTISLMEYYDGTQWKAIDAPPTVSSISPTTETDANANIVITGTNFSSGATVKFIGADATEYNSPSVTVDSSTQITATTPATALTVENEPYDIKVTAASGLSATLEDALDAGGVPSWTTASGSLATIYDSMVGDAVSLSVSATDPDGDTVTYALAAGDSLPSGLSLNTSTGAITGTVSAVGSDTTTTFDIEAQTDNADAVARTFSITVKAPTITSYTSIGSGTFTVPSGVTAVEVLVIAGGGSGGSSGGGGGAGGLAYAPAFPVTPGGSVSYSVGGGGANLGANKTDTSGTPGQNSTFGTITALGGGGGGDWAAAGASGGSGGGEGRDHPSSPETGAVATQPSQPTTGGVFNYGFAGGYSVGSGGNIGGGGGGGAGSSGYNSNSSDNAQFGGAPGGSGRTYNISGSSVGYAGGGAGAGYSNPSNNQQAETNPTGAPFGGGIGGRSESEPGGNGTANRGAGGGGGGGGGGGSAAAGNGGSGIVIVKY